LQISDLEKLHWRVGQDMLVSLKVQIEFCLKESESEGVSERYSYLEKEIIKDSQNTSIARYYTRFELFWTKILIMVCHLSFTAAATLLYVA
jgi:hypothetical protein